jgi:hypothetical protein
MSGQIIFFEKNKADYSNPNVSATASQGAAYAEYALNRSNNSAWVTTGSVDADNTTFTVDFTDPRLISEILLVKHNFKAYTVQYYDGSNWQNFSPAISETTNTAETNRYSVTEVSAYQIRITITGTQTANQDKYLYQFIATKLIGQLAGWPVIKSPVLSRGRRSTAMLSGKRSITESVGHFECSLAVKEWKSNADLTIVETLYARNEGFLVWLSGGVTSQFSSVRQGYRLEDIFLMKCANEYRPEFVDGIYPRGLAIDMDLIEVVE